MALQTSTGGVSSLPEKYNVNGLERLPETGQPVLIAPDEGQGDNFGALSSKNIHPGKLVECWYCHNFFHERKGYFHPRAFYCDECVWILAENGELYCG
ncbi:MAG TPA: hypothetical protein VFK06_25025 [Candidatus Angelobacter sp.]|nr:hypothetical protein [Candidatus Angelobacter sp.]